MSAFRPLMLQERRQSGHCKTSRLCQTRTLSTLAERVGALRIEAATGVGETPRIHGPRVGVAAALDDDISPRARDYGLDLCLLGLGHSEFVKSLLEIVEKGLPLGCSDHKMLVRVLHGTASVLLRPTGSPANHFCDEILEAWRGNTM